MNIKSAYKYAYEQLKSISDELHYIEFDIALLLKEVLKKDKTFIFAHPEYNLSKREEVLFKKFIERRKLHEPVAYIIGYSYFFNLKIEVNKKTLIPRPSTELLVSKALETVDKIKTSKLSIIDIGTGSGAIIIAIAKNLPTHKKIKLIATDNCSFALKKAQKNAQNYKLLDKIDFLKSDLFQNIPNQKFNIIVSNLPYLSEEEYLNSPTYKELSFEPKKALVAPQKGLLLFKKFFQQAPKYLDKKGFIFLEIGYNQAETIYKMAKIAFPISRIKIIKDHCGFDRILQLHKI